MPCRSPQTVSVAQPTTYLSSMSQQPNQTQQHNASQQQQHQSQLGSINGRASAVAAAVNAAQQQINNAAAQQQLLTSQQQQVSAVASAVALPLQLAAAQAQQQNAQQQQNGKKPMLRDLYTEKALADIKNSLRPYEAADGQPLRPVSSLSTGSSNNSDYSNIILSLMNMGFDEVSQEFYFICFSDVI